jgi:Cys-rich protein (TIGR01571 family)
MFQERQRQHAQQQKNAQQKNSLAFQNEEFPSNSEKRRPIVVGVQSNQYQHHSTYGESRSDYESGDHTDVHGGNYRELFDYEDSRKNYRMDDRSESGSTFQSSTNANNPKKNRDYDSKMTAKSFEESYDDQALMRQRLFDKIEHTSRVLRTTTDGRIRESHLHQLKTLRDEWDRLKTQAVHPFSVDCDNTSSKKGAKRLWRGEQIVLRPPGSIIGEGAEDKSIGLKSARSGKSTMSKSNIFDDDNRSCVSGPASRPMGKPTVSVVAPETLPAGFTFEARLGDRVFMATVPEGGVAKGEVFCSVIGDIDSELDRASVRVRTLLDMGGPQERWRDELFDCFSEGFFHPQICNSMFCPQVALTQIMARMQMTANGERGITLNSRFRVKQAVWLTVGVITIHLMYAIPIFIRAPQNFNLYAVSSIPLMVMDLGILIYFWFLMALTRRAMREEYDIPEIHCRWLGCEDACLAVACTTCTLSQMGRHSADYTTYRAMCCSDTGLPNHVEVKLPSDPMNEMI